ncbi:hypothetical protein CAP36_06780 [Chitinophagaceae bacterium IBVUCB2]|nr:hypothetical protein CAP36_06780 [Chitinophagaceae bacterium IBVUCB2]
MATGLIEFRPKVGAPEENITRSETYLMYDDDGIYFGGYLYERTKDSISTELRGRDGFGNNDFIGIIFDTYKDHQNGFEYFITPLNEQMDAKQSPVSNGDSEDFSWNAVWESGAVIHADGWSFEMFIPYSAIRFGSKNVQDWGLNITRRRQKTGQQYMWNPVDPNVNGFLTQEGYWTGITNIKAPLRLQFSPYFSTYANHFPANIPGVSNWSSQVNGGLDVKYGITPAFTLDATLIPDFGQVQSDNRILNLTPFDVQFNENRAFFTEGTELFSKGGLFYSRRIGVEPVYNKLSVGTDEIVTKQPRESKLINATKISGRTQKGLGIGLLNAVTKPRYATLENTISKENRTIEVEPLTNYNVLVLDQTLKNNSSVSLVNTNVWRSGGAYDANVTAALFSLNDKKNMWNVSGKAALSNQIGYLPDGKTLTGYSQSLSFGKTSGRFNFSVFQDITDTKYTNRDLGFFTNNNFLIHGLWVGYRWTEPKNWYNRIFIDINTRYSKLLTKINPIDQTYQTSNLNFNINMQSKKLWWVGGYVGLTFRENDFYEPRWMGHFFRRNASLGFGGWFESNSAKKYSFYGELFGRRLFNFYNGIGFDYFLQQNYRFNSKLSLTYRISVQPRFNNVGYAYSENNSEIIFARRNRRTVENVLSSKYNFTNRMGLTFRLRHYYSSVDNKEFFTLRSDGKLNPNPAFNKNVNRNLNLFNIDMVYTWQFAPGSFLNLVWKSSVEEGNNIVEKNYIKNFNNTLEADQINNLSMKVIYFLDYLQIKNKKKKKIV